MARGQRAGVPRRAAVPRPLPGRADALSSPPPSPGRSVWTSCRRPLWMTPPLAAALGGPVAGPPSMALLLKVADRVSEGVRKVNLSPGRPRRGRGGSRQGPRTLLRHRPGEGALPGGPARRRGLQGRPARRPAAARQRFCQGSLPAGGEGVAGPRARPGR